VTWLTKLRTYLGQDEAPSHPPEEGCSKEAEAALESAQMALISSKQRRVQTTEVASSLAALNSRNHYGESIYLAMMPKEKRV
jgi:hypothetical protein